MKKVLAILLVMLTLTGCTNNPKKQEENKPINNESYASIKDKKVGNLDITDFLVIYQDNISTIYFDINNNTTDEVNYKYLIIKLYDSSKKQILSYKLDLGLVNPNDIRQVKESFDADLTKANSVEYELTNE